MGKCSLKIFSKANRISFEIQNRIYEWRICGGKIQNIYFFVRHTLCILFEPAPNSHKMWTLATHSDSLFTGATTIFHPQRACGERFMCARRWFCVFTFLYSLLCEISTHAVYKLYICGGRALPLHLRDKRGLQAHTHTAEFISCAPASNKVPMEGFPSNLINGLGNICATAARCCGVCFSFRWADFTVYLSFGNNHDYVYVSSFKLPFTCEHIQQTSLNGLCVES